MADLLDKDFKTPVLNLKELKEDVEKVKKTMYEQNVNINKEIENLKRNSGAESSVTEMKNSLEGFKGRFEPARRKNQ